LLICITLLLMYY